MLGHKARLARLLRMSSGENLMEAAAKSAIEAKRVKGSGKAS
jgi:hypothetical protein